MAVTLTFDEGTMDPASKGWVSFHDYLPDDMIGLKNRLYSIKDGQLWVHEDTSVERNNFYGEQFDSYIETIFNDSPGDMKVFKTINIESNKAWEVDLTTDQATGKIYKDEFEQFEGEFYAHTRQNEDATDYTSSSAVKGLGRMSTRAGKVLNMSSLTVSNLQPGDGIYRYDVGSDAYQLIGICNSYTSTSITVDSITATPIPTDFLVSIRNPRIESSEIRGYYLMVKLTSPGSEDAKIFAVNSEVFQSKS